MADNKILNNDVLEVKGVIAHGELRIGTHAVHTDYTGLWNTEASTTTTGQYLIISAGTDTYVNGDNVYIRAGNNSTSNQVKITTSGTTIGGNTVWHAGNDGSGSGLDADTVDGSHASDFATASHAHAASDVTSGTFSTDRLPKQELGVSIQGNFGQWLAHNTHATNGFNDNPTYWGWTFIQGNTSAPHSNSSQWYRGRFSLGNQYGLGTDSGDYWMELAIPRYSYGSYGNMYIRTCENGSVGSWSGVRAAYATDADTVDGIHASSFLRSDANDTTSGTITLSGTDWYLLGLGARGASSGAYGIGNRNDDTYRQLTFHVPNQAAYSSTGTIPSFGWYSNGSDELMKLESASGNLWLKGELDVDTITIGAGVTLTESTDRSDLLMIKSSTSSWGGLQVSNTSNEVIFSLMGNDNTLGLYDDLNDDWILQRTENGATSLYHNAGAKLSTTSTGISVTGGIVASELVEANSGLKVDNVITHTTDALSGHNSANTTTNRYKFMELAYNSYHWIGSSPIIIEVFQRDFQGAEYAKYILQNGSMDSGGSQDGSGNGVDDFRLILKESNCVDGNSNNHRIFVGDPEDTGLDQSSYDIYKIPIYLDAWYYSDYSVKITMASSSLTRVTSFTSATQYIFNESPTATTYSGTPTALPSAPNAVYGKLYGDAYIHNLSSTDSLDTTYYLDPAGNSNLSGNLTVGGKLTVSTVDATSTAVTALLLGAGNEVKKRGLGSNAFNSTTIPTNNNQLTNGAGYITGVGWSDLSGDQSEIPVSGFNNDAGYLTAHPSITEAADVNNSGGTVIQDLTFDDNGHVTATGSVNLDNIYTSTDGSENDFRFGLNLGNFTGTRWYRVGTVNTGSGGMRIRGMLTNHVESFGSCMIDLAIQGREGNNNNEIEITGHVHSLNQNSGIAVYQSDTSSGSYRNWDVYVVATKYTQCELDLTKVSCSFDTSGSNVTTEPSGTKELDTSSLTEGNYVIVNSVAKEIYHEGHKPTYSELGTMAYTNLTGTPTIPTNNNQLTNGAGYVTGVAWNELSGDQSEIQISGFNNDSGYLTAHPSISAATSVDNSGRTYIQDITLDSNGHVTAITSATETVVNTNTTYSAGTNIGLSSTTFNLDEFLNGAYPYQNKRWGNADGIFMPMVKGGLYSNSTPSITGRLRIKLPHYRAAIMQSFVIDVYEYNTDRMQSYIVSGYTYNDTNATWYNTSAIALADSDNRNLTVRFGSNETDDYQCVSIGETNTSWSYPQVVVRDYMGGYNAQSGEVLDEWTIEFVTTDSATYDASHTNNTPIVLTSRLSGTISTSQLADNSVNAAKLNVSGNGTSGQVLTSDGDGTFSWTAKTTNTNTVTSVGTSGNEATGTVTIAGSGATSVSQSGNTITISSTDNNTTYSAATTSADGLMSSTDKTKLDGVATGANAYVHPTGAGNKHIPSGGAAGQFLKYSSSGTAVWATPSYTTNTNTTYSAGSGLDLTSTTFSVEPDLRDGITHVGKDSNNYIQFDSTNGRIDFYAGGVFVARMESDGDLHVKGDVIAFSDIFG